MQQRGNGNKDSLLSGDERKEAGNTYDTFCERYFRGTKENTTSCDFFCTREIFSCLKSNYQFLCNCPEEPAVNKAEFYKNREASCKESAVKCTAATCLTPFAIVGTTLSVVTDFFRGVGRCITSNKKEDEPSEAPVTTSTAPAWQL